MPYNTLSNHKGDQLKKEKTHAQIFVKDKERLEKLRDKHGYASIAVTLSMLLKRKI